jgi:nitrogen fixation NifU-like protein
MGEMENPDGVGEVGNMRCGDVMKIYIRVGTRNKPEIRNPKPETISKLTNLNVQKTEEYVEDIKFQTLGCAAAIAASSVTTDLAKGKSLEDAMDISKDDINEALGKLPTAKYHCSILADQGIKKAIEDYRDKASKEEI